MKLNRAHQWFVGGVVLGAAAWTALWPRRTEPAQPRVADVPSAVPRWSKASLDSALAELGSAKTAEQKLAAVARLNEIPIEEIPAALGSIETVKNRRLTFEAGTLLVRWSSKEGPAALSWAWGNLGKGQAWNEALKEIGPAWAWRDPEGFGRWIKATTERRKPELTLAPAVAEASDDPILDMNQVGKAVRWLIPGKPSLAFEILKDRPGWSSDDYQVVDLLRTVEQAREALLAFKDVDRIDVTKPRGEQIMALSVLHRWKDIDPEDFARSPYGSVLAITKFESIDNAAAELKSVAPEGRAAKADATLGSNEGPIREYAISKIAREWAAVDVAAAASWLESLPEENAKIREKAYAAEISITHPEVAFRRIASLPPFESCALMTTAFDAWHKKRPGQSPDMTGWSDAQRRDWADLQALGAK